MKIEDQFEVAKKILIQEGELSPIVVAETENNEIHLIAVPELGHPDRKMLAFALLKGNLQKIKTKECLILMEVWFANCKKDDNDRTPPSERADRKEGLACTYLTKDEKEAVCMFVEIIREGDKIVGFKEPEILSNRGDGHIESRYLGLLK